MSGSSKTQDVVELMTQGLRQAGFSPLQEYSSFDRENDEWRDPEIDLQGELTDLYEKTYSKAVINKVAEALEADHGPWGCGN